MNLDFRTTQTQRGGKTQKYHISDNFELTYQYHADLYHKQHYNKKYFDLMHASNKLLNCSNIYANELFDNLDYF